MEFKTDTKTTAHLFRLYPCSSSKADSCWPAEKLHKTILCTLIMGDTQLNLLMNKHAKDGLLSLLFYLL